MESNQNNWSVGEMVIVPKKEKLLKKRNVKIYEHCIGSRYICIREASDGCRGILMKVLGRINGDQIKIIKNQPFCVDYFYEQLYGCRYSSYPFPSVKEVQESLDIIRANKSLLQKFEEASMHINPYSTFWVNNISRTMFFLRKLQYFGGRNSQLYSSRDDSYHYRITFVYFDKEGLHW